MSDPTSHVHSTGDEALSHLSRTPGAIGEFVCEYPGLQLAEESDWLEKWFKRRTDKHFRRTLSESEGIVPPSSHSNPEEVSYVAQSVKLRWLEASHFRGFRESCGPINFDDGLVVVEGRNSSGKTSLAEALEWLFTGALSRREQGGSGNPRELDQCITNQFRPEGADTWVSATFAVESQGKNREVTLRRVLVEDYGTTGTAVSKSILYVDDLDLSKVEEHRLLEEMFGGVPPILMQHTLRDFVHSEPRKRREYFERLLRLDELTEIIRRAVVGDSALSDYPGPSGHVDLQHWTDLEGIVGNGQIKKYWNEPPDDLKKESLSRIHHALVKVGRDAFPELLGSLSEIHEVEAVLVGEQNKAHLRSFPILVGLRPQDPLTGASVSDSDSEAVRNWREKITSSYEDYQSARKTAESIGQRNMEIARSFAILVDAGIVDLNPQSQMCPICEYQDDATLTADRIGTIQGWNPIAEAERVARRLLKSHMEQLLLAVSDVLTEHERLLPSLPSESQWSKAVEGAGDELRGAALKLREVRVAAEGNLGPSVSAGRKLVKDRITRTMIEDPESFVEQCTGILERMEELHVLASQYSEAFVAVEEAAAVEASVDPNYRLREALLKCIQTGQAISESLDWERSRERAQIDLEKIRGHLMAYRQDFLNMKRILFSDGIQEIWDALRDDRYSFFSQLHIPKPRGRGFPVEFELKAVLDDSRDRYEVDALRVFSESQVNALGIAAFITRGRLLGHRILIFDDPVQSMDEDHFKTFASSVVPHVLSLGFQIILFTHNDKFARDLSQYHYDRQGYATLQTRQSRRDGVIVEEGSRRVQERLKLAERKAEEGSLPEAWRNIRLAVERLYTIAYIRYGPPNFKPESWHDQTAEHMWNGGAGDIIQSRVPESPTCLKDILKMAVAGGHDTPPRGETDLRRSTKFLRKTLNELKLGGG